MYYLSLSLHFFLFFHGFDFSQPLQRFQNECETLIDLTSDDEESAPIPESAASAKPYMKTSRFLNFKSSTIRKEKSRKTQELLPIQTKINIEQKSNRKLNSAQKAQKRIKIQLNGNAVNVSEVEPDVYDFDEDDNEPMLKKKRRVVQPKKRRKPKSWPRINVEQNEQVKRSPKVYTIRAKVPVGTQAKVIAERKIADQDEKSAIEVVDADVIDFVENESDLSIYASISIVNEAVAKSAKVAPDIEVYVPEKTVKVAKKVAKISKLPPSTAKPVQLPAQIIANIAKINNMVKVDNKKCSNESKPHRKSREIVCADSSTQLKQKSQPRKLYTEIEPEFDDMDKDETDAVKNQTADEDKTNQNSSQGNLISKPDSTGNSIVSLPSIQLN